MRRILSVVSALGLVAGLVATPALAAPGDVTAPDCQPAEGPDGPRDDVTRCQQVIESFDGTMINTYLFTPDEATAASPRPIIFRTHGWGSEGERDLGESTIARLVEEGWNVLTWDQRGFGDSGGAAEVDSPAFERRDAEMLIDYVATLPTVALERPGDPRLGFTGISYAGAIQTVTASFDDRVDVIAPEITWNDLRYSLYPREVLKDSWIAALLAFSADDTTARWINEEQGPALVTGQASPEVVDRFGFRSYATRCDGMLAAEPGQEDVRGKDITIPTLLLQGNVDTLFDLWEVRQNFKALQAAGAPTKLFIFCGGVDGGGRTTHGFCPSNFTDAGDIQKGDDLIVDWMRRYLDQDTAVDTGPTVEWESNLGVFRRDLDFPTANVSSPTLRAQGVIAATGTQFQAPERPAFSSAPSSTAGGEGGVAVDSTSVIAASERALDIFGIPRATVTVSLPTAGAPSTGESVNVFLKLVDVEDNQVIDFQEAPLRVDNVSGSPQTFEFDMPGLAHTLPEGHSVKLQVATDSVIYSESRTPTAIRVDATVAVPVQKPQVERVSGSDRIATSVGLSDVVRQAADTVVLARADDYADALAGVPLASKDQAPVLLTPTGALDDRAAREIRRLGASKVILLGGEAALSGAVATAAQAILDEDGGNDGDSVERISGPNRFATAVAIARRLDASEVFLVEGIDANPARGWPDAVSAGPLASAGNRPILLTPTESLAPETAAALDELNTTKVTLVGGPAALSQQVETHAKARAGTTARISGLDRYETSRKVADATLAAGADPATVVFATGSNFPDALASGPVAVSFDAPLLLINGSAGADTPPGDFLRDNLDQIERVVMAGGRNAIPTQVEDQVNTLLRR